MELVTAETRRRIAIVGLVGDHAQEFLSWWPEMMGSAYADRRERRFRVPDFRRGSRVKVVSPKKTAAVDHHRPLRPLAPLDFPDSSALFSLEQNCNPETLHCNCWRRSTRLKR